MTANWTGRRTILAVAALALLGFLGPMLWQRRSSHAPSTNARAAISAHDTLATDSAAPEAAPASPLAKQLARDTGALKGFTGTARIAGQALLDRMLKRHGEMSKAAEQERTRIQAMEPVLEDLEQRIKDSESHANDLSQQLERMRAAGEAGTRVDRSEYDALQKSYNDEVAQHNQLIEQYDKQFAEYTTAVQTFDRTIAEYESKTRSALHVPTPR